MDLLQIITYEGLTSSQIKEKTELTKTTLYRQLENLLNEKIIIKNGSVYSKLRETPTTGSLIDSLKEYHSQRLMDWKYRRLQKDAQADTCLMWLIDGNAIPGKIEQYNVEKLESNINEAYNSFTNLITKTK